MKNDKIRNLYVADFETTVEEDDKINEQTETEVWSAAICPVFPDRLAEYDDCDLYNNIFDFIGHLERLEDDSIVFFHNLRFDASFLLNTLNRLGYYPAMDGEEYLETWKMKQFPNTYKVIVNNMGQWYSVVISFEGKTIELRDSAKKLPFTLEQIGKSFNTKYKKLEMDYQASHKAFGIIRDDEIKYQLHDVLCLSEAIHRIWFEYGLQGMTIGSDCLKEFKALRPDFDVLFPNLCMIDMSDIGADFNGSVDAYIRKAYAGGWCYKSERAEGKVFIKEGSGAEKMVNDEDSIEYVKNIVVLDVNSLYPSMMVEPGNMFPVGRPEYHKGEPKASHKRKYFIYRRFKCRFSLKPGMLPFVHVRGEFGIAGNENLKTSDINGSRYYHNRNGEEFDTLREYTMTEQDFEMFQKCYKIKNYEPIDYLTFEQESGIFDDYINKYKQMKIDASKEHNKVKRQIAKLMLNNLYGKMATSANNSYKTIHFDDDVMKFDTVEDYKEEKTIHIACGAAITSYARCFTLNAAIENEANFAYSDTDSIHLFNINVEEIKGVKIDDSEFSCWAPEVSSASAAVYCRQKTYIEIVEEENFEKKETPEFLVKAAGLSNKGKNMFVERVESGELFLDDFKSGLLIRRCNLKAKQIKGGTLLVPSDFQIK